MCNKQLVQHRGETWSALPERRKGVQDATLRMGHTPGLLEGKQQQTAAQVLMMDCWCGEIFFHAWESHANVNIVILRGCVICLPVTDSVPTIYDSLVAMFLVPDDGAWHVRAVTQSLQKLCCSCFNIQSCVLPTTNRTPAASKCFARVDSR